MVSISTRVDKGGFWYLVDAIDESKITLSYIVIGTGGRQGSGEIKGISSNLKDWQYVESGFPVLQVGITDLRINRHLPGDAVVQKLRPQAEQLSRRKALKNTATVLLTGGAMMVLPTGISYGQTPVNDFKPVSQPSGITAANFNPYSAGSKDIFNPYSAKGGELFNPYSDNSGDNFNPY